MRYLLIINLIAFVCMCMDKQLARHKKNRMSEKFLFFIAIIGGTFGSILGMYAFRHKTKHVSFVIGMPIIFVFQLIIGYFLLGGQI